MKRSFRQELVHEIVHQFAHLSIIVSLLMFLFLISAVFYIQYYQLDFETKEINQRYETVVEHAQKNLTKMNQRSIPNFINNGKDEQEIYAEYYRNSAVNNNRSILLVLDKNFKTQLSTQANAQKQIVSVYYLRTVIEAANFPDQALRITKGNDGNNYLIVFNKVYQHQRFLGYSMLFLNGNDFLINDLSYGTNYVIADQFNHVYARNNTTLIQGHLHKIKTANFKHRFAFIRGKGYLTKTVSLNKNFKLYTYELLFPIQIFFTIIIVTMACLLTFLLYQSKRLAEKIANRNTSNIEQLVNEVKEVSLGAKKKITIDTDDEFKFLADSINQMITDFDELTNQKVALEKQKSQYEKRMLEAQFNPHFLYNTLESIRIVSKFDVALTEKLILSLNRVLRYSVDHGNEETTVGEDLEVLKDFLEVNKVRFEYFNYEIEVDERLKNLTVPRLFIMPIVANSLKYGMKIRSDVIIKVKAYYNDLHEIVFEVRDNGAGFSQKRIEQVYQQYEDEATYHGLINSYRRLKIMFPLADLRIVNHAIGASVCFVLIEGDLHV